MNFNEYQDVATSTAIFPNGEFMDEEQRRRVVERAGQMYLGLKLAGEAGEVSEKIGKAIRDGVADEAAWRLDIAKELGDVLWYVSQIAREIGFQFTDIAAGNVEKITDRQRRGVLRGSGDDR